MAEKKSTRGTRLWRTAIHEAGHAVASYFLHVRIKHVTIVPTGNSLGHQKNTHVQFGRHGLFDDSLKGVDRAERHIMVCFAGQIAQRKQAPRSRWRAGGSGDSEAAATLFSYIDHPDRRTRDLYASLLWRKTECLVDARWREIQAVANALLKHKTLDAAQIAAVIDDLHGLRPLRFESRSAAGV